MVVWTEVSSVGHTSTVVHCMAMWHVFPCTHTPKSGGVAMGEATVVVAVCVDDVMGCACHPHTLHTGRESSHKGTCHPHHVCVSEAEEWAVDEHSGLVVCVVVVGEEGWCGGWWWQKHRKG